MQPKPIAVKATRGLGITQIIVGSLMLVSGILSIALVDYWASYVGFAIWGGIWVIIGGIFGVYSAANTSNEGWYLRNLVFAIVSAIVMSVDIIIYSVAVGKLHKYYTCDDPYLAITCYYTTNSTGVAIYSCLSALSVVELFVAVAVVIVCRRGGCSGCCNGETREAMVQQPGMTPSSALLQPDSQTPSYQTNEYKPTTYPAASYPHGSGPSVPPSNAPYKQSTYSTN